MKWFRAYNDTPNDPKLRRIAHQAGTTVGHTLAVWFSMLCHASENRGEQRGTLAGWDDTDCAFNLGIDRAVVFAIRQEMQGRILDGERIIAWEKRQYQSDNGYARVKAWREKKRQENQTDSPQDTYQKRITNVSETAKIQIQNRTEDKEHTPSSRRASRAAACGDQDFDRFWSLYPRKIGKGAARKAWAAAVKRAEEGAASILAGITVQTSLDRFDTREGMRFVPHPSTWLNGDRWLDGLDAEEAEPTSDRNAA